ncbi:MAG: ACT domain-containing protein [Armatimonadota bacterium]|nr:MAG: ACT domain-containing protein [Armatimonadota bacterium]
MNVSQLSVFLENKSGRLAEVTQVLAANDVNIRALCIAETIDYGVLRLIVNDPGRAKSVLAEHGFTVTETAVLVVELEDRPGGLAQVIKLLADQGINIEYLYAFLTRSEKAFVVFRLENIEEAAAALSAAGVRILTGAEIYGL